MARKRAARERAQSASRPAAAKPARPGKLSKLVSALKAGAKSMAKRAKTRRAPAGRASASSTAKPASKKSAPPIAHRSVVRAPARRPTVRAKRQAATEKPPARASARRRVISTMSAPGAPDATAPTALRHPAAPSAASAPLPHARTPLPEEQFSIPTGYGDDRIVLLVKDPWWVYAYWEIQPGTERSARSQLLPQEAGGLQSVLRVYDVTGVDYPSQPAHRYFDIGLSGLAMNWYLHTNAPGRQFIVEIGLLANSGRFLMLARSNRVAAPRFGPADEIDEQWMVTDEAFWKLFGATSGIAPGSSPSGLTQMLSHQLASGAWSSYGLAGKGQAALRGFTVRVDHDLVIHGAAEPKATVVIQGHQVAVRKDGSFSMRLALPEGTQHITIEVRSADGRQTRTVTPVISVSAADGLTPNSPKLAATEAPWPKLEPRDEGTA